MTTPAEVIREAAGVLYQNTPNVDEDDENGFAIVRLDAALSELEAEVGRLREALEQIAVVAVELGREGIAAAARLALSQPPQEDDLPESSKFIASGYGKTWDEQGPIPQPPQEDK